MLDRKLRHNSSLTVATVGAQPPNERGTRIAIISIVTVLGRSAASHWPHRLLTQLCGAFQLQERLVGRIVRKRLDALSKPLLVLSQLVFRRPCRRLEHLEIVTGHCLHGLVARAYARILDP